ncbi:MAG TPA: TonB-dependent receptor, partial [Comamonadaceae bacterium]|nr:TonB-dependent receptor [Comamonadaceae bacterium]
HADLTLGVEKEDRFRDKHGTVTGVTQAALDPKGTLGRDYARHFDVDLERVNLTYSNDLSEHTNLLALAYQYRDHTRFWSAPQRFSVSGAPISSPDAYTLFNDYHQTQRGVKSELRTTMGTVAWMGGVEFKRNEYLNRTHAMVGFRNSPSPMERPTAAGTVFTDDRTGENVQAIYGEGQWRLATDWTLTGNLRHDRIELDYDARPVTGNSHSTIAERKTFDATSARLGLSWSGLANTVLFGNLSTGFRAPTVDQLYRGSQSPSGSVANNPDLRTERATNVEIGMRKTFTLLEREASLQAAVFQIDRRDFILDSNGQYGNSSAAHIARYENIGGARSRGLELALQSA